MFPKMQRFGKVLQDKLWRERMNAAFLSAVLCVVTRALLNICDRKIFQKEATDFLKSIFYNALFPFLVSWAVTLLCFDNNSYFAAYLFEPGVISSALGAQAAAMIFSHCFSKMTVKSVVVSSKMADLFIPLMIFLVTSEYKISDYCFSLLSTILFFPILYMIIKYKSEIYFKTSLALIVILVFQAGINSYFAMHALADSWVKFLSMVTCILLWRIFFIMGLYAWEWVKALPQSEHSAKKNVAYLALLLRAFLAFISQAAFFYSITRVSGNIAWPLLNSTPLVACFSAHILLREHTGKTELWTLAGFLVLSTFYIVLHGSVS